MSTHLEITAKSYVAIGTGTLSRYKEISFIKCLKKRIIVVAIFWGNF